MAIFAVYLSENAEVNGGMGSSGLWGLVGEPSLEAGIGGW